MAVSAPELPKHPALAAAATQQQHDNADESPYERDIDAYAYLRSMERAPGRVPAPNYLDGSGHLISPATRAVLVGHLASAAHSLGVHSRTLHLAVSCLDRFLNRSSSSPATTTGADYDYYAVPGVAVAAAAALFAAVKYEELYWLGADDVIEYALKAHPLFLDAYSDEDSWPWEGHPLLDEDVFTKADLVEAERVVLQAVGYDMSAPTRHTFLDHFLERLLRVHQNCRDDQRGDSNHHSAALLASYLAELSLLDYGMLRFRPSIVAASALLVARLTTTKKPWGPRGALEAATGYAAAELEECALALHRLQWDSISGSNALGIQHKYSQKEFESVATLLPVEDLVGAMETDDEEAILPAPDTCCACAEVEDDLCNDDISNKTRAVRVGEFLCPLQVNEEEISAYALPPHKMIFRGVGFLSRASAVV